MEQIDALNFEISQQQSEILKLRTEVSTWMQRYRDMAEMFTRIGQENVLLIDQLNMLKLATFQIEPDKFESHVLHRINEQWVDGMGIEQVEVWYQTIIAAASAIRIAEEKYNFSLKKAKDSREKKDRQKFSEDAKTFDERTSVAKPSSGPKVKLSPTATIIKKTYGNMLMLPTPQLLSMAQIVMPDLTEAELLSAVAEIKGQSK